MLPPSLVCPRLRQNANTILSLQFPMKFSNIVRVETSRYLIKITTWREGSGSQAYGFATTTMYKLAAIKRNWMCVPNLKSRSVLGRSWSCTSPCTSQSPTNRLKPAYKDPKERLKDPHVVANGAPVIKVIRHIKLGGCLACCVVKDILE